ncbi:MAG TPA: antibiotic biosynthesis monooxygenase [Propionibacteriaceae bacterium]|nr:antibiotic biosynthesis monooxygenase [Propionibacteriaceae bacterium]
MIVEYIRYLIEPERADAFRQAYAAASVVLQRDPRCLSYEIVQGVEEPSRFVVRIEWTSLEDHLEGFRHDPAFSEFFALVGPYVDDIRAMQHYEVKTSSPALPEKGLPTLYEWAGGQAVIAAFINAFYDRVERDDLIGPLFPGGVKADHREHVAAWWTEVLGGPNAYTPLGGYARMLAHHLGLNITVEQRRRFVYLISVAADDAKLPDDPEFRAAIIGYTEWATRLAMHNSQTGAHVVREAPMPHWGWGVAPPYVG